MIERIGDMPEGTVGFRANGEVTAGDYKQVLEPVLREAAEAGEVRMLYVIEDGFEMTAGAYGQDAKTGIELGFGHLKAWKRTALVTDVEWVARALRMIAWMAPGEVRVFPREGFEEARDWVAS
jgi:hypothetical protein